MNERVLRILEFDKIREKLAALCVSEMGAAAALKVIPETESGSVGALITQTLEAESEITKNSNPMEPFPDMRVSLKSSQAALALSMKELLGVKADLRVSRALRTRLCAEDRQGILKDIAARLYVDKAAESEIERCILSEDELSDNASPELARIRRQMRILNARVREKLDAFIHSASGQKYLQEPIVTIRSGRFVLPVKQEYRQQVPGLLHDQSGSGATLFIEPMAVVEIGNELKKLAGDEEEECARILAALTALIRPIAEYIINSLELLALLDVIFAKAALARAMRANPPVISKNGVITVTKARHPLIPAGQVVPIDLKLGGGVNTLIVTGPNTGGKTVTLKTLGLFSVMAQAGLLLPAEKAELVIFKTVFADIGDEQSIEQSLSTFSSHMKNIVALLETADNTSLVLLDELGAGTDPNEGAALAMAVLDELNKRGCMTMATTHYSELKAFALAREGMQNASMEFDVETLRPTYKLFIGIPGKSNAFEISKKLGLGDYIIDAARKFLKHEDVRFEDVLSSAEQQRKLAERERVEAQKARAELEALRAQAERERAEIEERREKQIAKAKEEARTIVKRARDEAEQIIKDLRAEAAVGQSEKKIQQARDRLRRNEEDLSGRIEAASGGKALKSVQVGQSVLVASIGQKAVVLEKATPQGHVLVQAGIIKMKVALEDLRAVDEPSRASARNRARR
jgi:DNA mismatch repair protein MutS2